MNKKKCISGCNIYDLTSVKVVKGVKMLNLQVKRLNKVFNSI